jgi:putative two-component system response regulator
MNNTETILVVEDNHVLREGLRDILVYEGFTVMSAANGLEALEQMQMTSPDLILSDIAMPEMDGYELYKSVRAHSEWITIPFVFLTARGEREDIWRGKNMGVEDYIVKPLTREELLTVIHGRLGRSEQIKVAQLQQSYEASLTMLANAIDVRDPYTRGHVERVTAYSQELAHQMGFLGRVIEQIRFGAILHDIGKIIIQEATLFKTVPLNDKEWLEIQMHPITGAEMIKDIPYLSHAVPIIRYHHEHWDGTGYPDKLAGELIPIEARIVSVADGFDAMTSYRPYSQVLSLDEAYQEIQDFKGSQFDPGVVSAFEKAWELKKLHLIWENWRAKLV